jgi:parallel beta-helix repeat protein
LRGEGGQRVGISLGGGGSGEVIRRDGGRSGREHDNGRISDNLIAFCSDQGIYINRARNSQIEHNTLLDTSGIEIRFPQSSADIKANIIDGTITVRDGGHLQAEFNETDSLLGLFVGWHPQRRLFVDVGRLDLMWRGDPPRTSTRYARPDLCGASRGFQPAIGAFEDFSRCLSAPTH